MSGKKSVDSDVDRGKGNGINCYFCNNSFEMGQLQSHLKQCGSILEQCPLRCGAWIQRKHKDTHVKECPKMEKSVLGKVQPRLHSALMKNSIQVRNKSDLSDSKIQHSSSATHARLPDPTPPPTDHTWAATNSLDSYVAYLEKELTDIKMIITEDASHRDAQSVELGSLRARLSELEGRGEARAADEAERAAEWSARLGREVAGVRGAVQELQDQQLSSAMQLEHALGGLVRERRERELLEEALAQQDRQLRGLVALGDVVEYIKDVVEEERERSAASRAELAAEVAEARRTSQQLHELTALRTQVQHAASDRPSTDRLAVLELTVSSLRADAAALGAAQAAAEREMRALSRSHLKLRAELRDFQARVSFSSPELGCDDGHLIWRIDNVAARMKDAKENDSVLVSPLFRTSKHGYTLKAEVNLNGVGTWRGRHVTASLRVAASPHDALLQWPCELRAHVALKDQAADRTQAMDIVKSLTLRRACPQSAAGAAPNDARPDIADASLYKLKRQYVFIPHDSLHKLDYIKDDVMFFEIIVKL